MKPLRDEIADIVYDSNFEVGMHSRKTADAIIALLRDRLTSDAAVDAGLTAERRWATGGQDMARTHPQTRARRIITAALDTVSGKIRA